LTISSRAATAGLLVLVALDVVLVGMALRTNDTPVTSTSTSAGSAGASVSPSPVSSVAQSSAATGTATTAPAATVAPLQTLLVAIDTKRAWRITVGSCATGGAKVATTTDGGTTWTDAKAPLRTIVRVRPTDGQTAFVIGADSSCAAQLSSTSDGGRTWAANSAVGSAWFRDLKNPKAVRAPGPSTSEPCGQHDVLDLAVLSVGSARVLCANGLIRSTSDTGSSWTDSGRAVGAVALAVLAATPAQTYVAILGAPGCAGVEVRRVDQSAPTSCIATALPNAPGQIALSLVEGGGWLTVGDTTMRSTNKQVTWSVS